jgi:hypothetical protein
VQIYRLTIQFLVDPCPLGLEKKEQCVDAVKRSAIGARDDFIKCNYESMAGDDWWKTCEERPVSARYSTISANYSTIAALSWAKEYGDRGKMVGECITLDGNCIVPSSSRSPASI